MTDELSLGLSFGFLGTYPPTQCGLATFTASLATHIGHGAEIGIVEVADRRSVDVRPEVVHQLTDDSSSALIAAAAALDRYDVAVVQHEFGIYSGDDGETVVDVLRALHVPAIVVLHTVLERPTPHQRAVLDAVIDVARVVVVMTATAHRRLLEHYRVDPTRVRVIPHGAPTDWAQADDGPADGSHSLLTWGLLGPGKGIEWVIDALALLGDLVPRPRYVIAGETHPRVLAQAGERYRHELADRARRLGVGHLVTFDDRYLDQGSLRALVSGADVVVLPYDSRDQVTSGVLIEAVACRRPVVSTAFPHAVELLSTGAGIVVDHRDPAALAAAVRRVLTEPGLAMGMRQVAARLAPDLTWAAVAGQYRALGASLARRPVPLGA